MADELTPEQKKEKRKNRWNKIKKFARGISPILDLACPAVSKVVGAAFGTSDNEDEIIKAIEADQATAAVKLKEIASNHEIELSRLQVELEIARVVEDTNKIQAVNATMIAESKSSKWWVSFWRPFWGMLSALAFFLQVSAIAYLMFTNGNPELIKSIASLSVFWSVPLAIVGVAAYHRGVEKRIMAGDKVKKISQIFSN